MGCTVNDIARMAGVGRSTVLRALSGKPDVSTETRERVKALAASMRYRPNYIARSLTHGKTNLVGVLCKPSIYYASHSVIEAVECGLREGGYSTLLFITGKENSPEESEVDQLLKNRVDGVIAVPGSMTSPATYHELVEADIKLVTLDGLIDDLNVPQITGDNYKAGCLAAEHLISLGHRKISYLGIPQISNVGRERMRGVCDAFQKAQIPVEESLFKEIDFSESMAEKCTDEILSLESPPTSIICRHDVSARGAMRSILKRGLSVPKDISIVGNGDILGSDMFRFPLTTVRFPARQMADFCVKTILQMLSGEDVEPKTTVFDVELIVRSSTGPLNNP